MSQLDKKYKIKQSNIHGKGIFTTKSLMKNEDIDVGIEFIFFIIPNITPYFGSMINHSYSPNCYLRYKNNKWYVTASKKIPSGEEILLDYRNTPWYIMGPETHYK